MRDCVPTGAAGGGRTSHKRSSSSLTGLSRTDQVDAGLTECENILILPYLWSFSLRILGVQIWFGDLMLRGLSNIQDEGDLETHEQGNYGFLDLNLDFDL